MAALGAAAESLLLPLGGCAPPILGLQQWITYKLTRSFIRSCNIYLQRTYNMLVPTLGAGNIMANKTVSFLSAESVKDRAQGCHNNIYYHLHST